MVDSPHIETRTIETRTRVSAYAVCVRADTILLTRLAGGGDHLSWTMPGGGLDHGEDPEAAVLRELVEETGYTGEVQRLVGINSRLFQFPRGPELVDEMHALRIIYEVAITGGELRDEQDGSTDLAAWIPRSTITTLPRVDLVDTALTLYDQAKPNPT